jgi:hypothetical protein
LVHTLFIVFLSGTVKKFGIFILSSKYLESRMIDWIVHPTHLGHLHFFYLEYLTLLMCFDVGYYNHMSVVKKSLA